MIPMCRTVSETLLTKSCYQRFNQKLSQIWRPVFLSVFIFEFPFIWNYKARNEGFNRLMALVIGKTNILYDAYVGLSHIVMFYYEENLHRRILNVYARNSNEFRGPNQTKQQVNRLEPATYFLTRRLLHDAFPDLDNYLTPPSFQDLEFIRQIV